ncbi:MAG: PAS domain S-box protein [Deltaproteobacteria bacterium]|nr:PAS domain S-box protein [Deltaproteobacteria bacterium]MBW2051452.1 PAS domain S-box protein [Deltaproteobacteria bacterium]MBW2140680.1 PAS domain S-box protein [Deltaproteobacteria bacterium]MBW2322640.1 PAS domain S-box protein [Deltaproteobacteria bacterium]
MTTDSLKLMIVEDEEAHYDLMKRAVIKNFPEASVHHFSSASDSLEKVGTISPDIIITDYVLPGMTGIDFLKELRQKDREIPVIMITGQGDEKIAVEAIKLGAWDYLVKSVDFFTLLPSVIDKVFREYKLKESLNDITERFQDLVERTSNWIWEVDTQGKYIYSNPVVESLLGYRPDEMIGRYFFDFYPQEEKEVLKNTILQYRDKKKPFEALEFSLIHKNGHKVIIETNGLPILDKTGNLLGYRGVDRNISARKRAEQALRESEEQFRSIFNESPIGIEIFNSEGILVEANKSCFEIFGIFEPNDLIGFRLYDNPNVPDDAKAKLIEGKTVKYETYYDFEQVKKRNLYRTTKTENIYIDVLITPLGLKGGQPFSGYMVQIQDITSRKKAEDRIHNLSQQLIKAHEIERQKLSADLHDHLAQDLSALKIKIDTIFDDCPDTSGDKKRKVNELSKMATDCIMTVRNLAYDLRPAGLDQLGLVQTIYQHCEEFSHRNGSKVDFISAGMDDVKLDFDTEITLYRLIQEGMNNIKKHAAASQITIRLVASFPNIILQIEDNGKGFLVENRLEAAYNERHMGIQSMQERVALLNGKITIESRPTLGTKIRVEIPYTEETIGQQ